MDRLPEKDFNGYLEGITLADIVQLACLERYESKLEVRGESFEGKIYFSGGEIVHAETGRLVGQDAFVEILCCPAGVFSFTSGKSSRQTINISWNLLLMEATRLVDERNHIEPQEQGSPRLKVVVVDDSPIFSKALVKLFNKELGAKVVGKASTSQEFFKYLEMEKPDLVTLDIDMPVMNGDMTLKHIMIRSPAPVVLMSSFNEHNFSLMMDYLCIGAVDLVEKPNDAESWYIVKKRIARLAQNIGQFTLKNVRRAKKPDPVNTSLKTGGPAERLVLILGGLGSLIELQKIIAAIKEMRSSAGLVFLDLYPGVINYLADYLKDMTYCDPFTLVSGESLLTSQVGITYWHGSWGIANVHGSPVPYMKTEDGLLDADLLLHSAARFFGDRLSVVILSGTDLHMEEGLKDVREQGGKVFLQDPDSCLFPDALVKLEQMQLYDSYFTVEDINKIF